MAAQQLLQFFEPPKALPEFVVMDTRRLQQILYNLLGKLLYGIYHFIKEFVRRKLTLLAPPLFLSFWPFWREGNATKFSEMDGTIELSVSLCSADCDTTVGSSDSDASLRTGPAAPRAELSLDGAFSNQKALFPPFSSSSFRSNTRETVHSSNEFKSNTTGQVLRFVVKDYGRGIDKEDFATIFEPFAQANKETESQYGGTGMR